jgi:surface polysaccharide O-acyltransferase-like enzyme
LIQTTLRFRWPGVQNLYDDWANFTHYSLFFILGFALARSPAWEEVVAREWKRAGAIGLTAAAALLLGWAARGGVRWPAELPFWTVVGMLPLQALSGVAGYCLVVAILGLARLYLSFTNTAQDYLAESSLPVYVLHQLGIVLPGYFIIQLGLGIAPKLALLLATSVLCTMLVYHFLVRPNPLARALLGMKPERPAAPLVTGVNPRVA